MSRGQRSDPSSTAAPPVSTIMARVEFSILVFPPRVGAARGRTTTKRGRGCRPRPRRRAADGARSRGESSATDRRTTTSGRGRTAFRWSRAPREEAARLDAIRLAATESARATAMAKAAAEQRERDRQHELTMARTRALSGATTKAASAAVIGALFSTGLALLVHYGVLEPRAQRNVLALQQAIADQEQRVAAEGFRAWMPKHALRAEAADRLQLAVESVHRLTGEVADLGGSTPPRPTPRRGPAVVLRPHPAPSPTERPAPPGASTRCAPGSPDSAQPRESRRARRRRRAATAMPNSIAAPASSRAPARRPDAAQPPRTEGK